MDGWMDGYIRELGPKIHRTKLQESVNGNVAETCNSMFPLCLRKSGPVPLYTQQRKREKTSRNR